MEADAVPVRGWNLIIPDTNWWWLGGSGFPRDGLGKRAGGGEAVASTMVQPLEKCELSNAHKDRGVSQFTLSCVDPSSL